MCIKYLMVVINYGWSLLNHVIESQKHLKFWIENINQERMSKNYCNTRISKMIIILEYEEPITAL